MREFFDLANNPLFVKHVRSRLRRSAMLPGMVIVIFLSLCIVFINHYIVKGPNNPEPNVGSHMIFWLQGIILSLMGGSQVASAIAQMKESGIIDFHRITPVPPKVQAIGIMLGAPIRELILYALTLPFALFLAIDGPIGISNFAKLFLVQMGSAMMYYSLAMIAGLAGGKARGASGRFVAILAMLYLAAGQLYTAEIYGPALVTSVPVYYEVFIEQEEIQAKKQAVQQRRAAQQQQWAGPNNQAAANVQAPPDPKREVTFYGLALPVILLTLLFQGTFVSFLFVAASRRIHSARMPLYRKPIALLFMATVAALTLGSLWTARTPPFTLGSVYFLAIFAIILTNTVTPALGDVAKGVQRAHKLSGLRVPIWSDLSTNKFTVVGIALLMTAGIAIGIVHSERFATAAAPTRGASGRLRAVAQLARRRIGGAELRFRIAVFFHRIRQPRQVVFRPVYFPRLDCTDRCRYAGAGHPGSGGPISAGAEPHHRDLRGRKPGLCRRD